MDLRLLIASISIYEFVIIGLTQADIIPDTWSKMLDQFPILAIAFGIVYLMLKMQREDNRERREERREETKETREWLEKMLDDQRDSLKEAYTNHVIDGSNERQRLR